ncbi:phosphodiester glycosidase family protein [Sphingobacterium sp. InxBP1]|uniref:phosphodiester glycosidase family protein n=1 Tax=Sphingobacterium sp. InxBP1 TaxID=2870328 RepID=UPI002243FBFC|nr:phosphodiester glycosidase family protein [Sphingobacterium sp. InxBP1]MCW8313084.1 phosphodiester glycosidase family protein [Sphingobacterium sp. InxBP1]
MKRNFIYSLLLLFLVISCKKNEGGTQLPYDYSIPQQEDLAEIIHTAAWNTKTVADGVVWKYYQFPRIFESKQYVNVFEIDLKKGRQLEIPYVKTGFLKTSAAATAKGALVAFNGSYFNTSTGGSTVFFKYDGQVINQTVNGFNSYRENGAFTFTGQSYQIVPKPAGGWGTLSATAALAGGPLLMQNGQVLEQLNVDFNTSRHPRTAVGLTKDNKLIVAVIDGRSSQSQGLTIPQLGQLMAALGCTSALNYDGGGSSTAWVKGEGVVNYPSDNGKFDHEGERAVATVFTVK